jgi:hypothetical protein
VNNSLNVNKGQDDDMLLAALRAAVEARAAVPDGFIAAGRNAYAWHNIDAELARLSYDSLLEDARAALRSETASIRALTFQSAHFAIEVEVTDDALFCQLVPAQPGTAEIVTRSGQAVSAPIDEVGCFTFGPLPDGPFRLRCHTETQAEVRTGWVELLTRPGPPGPGRSGRPGHHAG